MSDSLKGNVSQIHYLVFMIFAKIEPHTGVKYSLHDDVMEDKSFPH